MASADESKDAMAQSADTDATAEESSDQVNADDTGGSSPATSDSVVDDGVFITTEIDPNSDGLSEPNSDDPSGDPASSSDAADSSRPDGTSEPGGPSLVSDAAAPSGTTSEGTEATEGDAGAGDPKPPFSGCLPFSVPVPSEQTLANTTSYRTPLGDGMCVYELDYEGDGCVDGVYRQTVSIPGESVTGEDDIDGNGELDHRSELTYDPATNVLLLAMDEDLDAIVDWTFRYFYDDGGRVVRSEYDRGVDGMLEQVQTSEFDSDGHLLRAATLDADGNPTVSLAIYEYDDNGGRLTATLTGAGQADQFVGFENDDQGRPLLEQHYTGEATEPDLWIVTSYDDAKRQTTELQYYSEGSPNLTTVKTFDAQGRVILTELRDATGELYEVRHTVFDEAGNQHRTFVEASPTPIDDRRRSFACHQ